MENEHLWSFLDGKPRHGLLPSGLGIRLMTSGWLSGPSQQFLNIYNPDSYL